MSRSGARRPNRESAAESFYRFDADVGMDIGRKVAARTTAIGLPADNAYLPAAR